MNYLLLFLIWVLNLGISWFNGVNVGKAWVESKHAGGGRRFMAWCGAVMTAVGFTWCIMIVLGLIADAAHLLDAAHLELFFATAYVILVPPLLFAGYAITVNSWANAYRERTFANTAAAGYNTFASAYNTYSAVTTFRDAFGKMLDGFSGKNRSRSSGNDDDSAQTMLVLILLIIAIGGGTLIAYWLINKYAAADEPLPAQRRARRV